MEKVVSDSVKGNPDILRHALKLHEFTNKSNAAASHAALDVVRVDAVKFITESKLRVSRAWIAAMEEVLQTDRQRLYGSEQLPDGGDRDNLHYILEDISIQEHKAAHPTP